MRTFLGILPLVLANLVFVATPVAALNPNSLEVMVVFNGLTETNREGLNHLRKAFTSARLPYTLKFTQKPQEVVPGRYRAVVVFNAGVANGAAAPAALDQFVKTYPAKAELIVLTFVRNTTDVRVTVQTAATSPWGVDSVTAATLWPKTVGNPGGLTREAILTMHDRWMEELTRLLAGA